MQIKPYNVEVDASRQNEFACENVSYSWYALYNWVYCT